MNANGWTLNEAIEAAEHYQGVCARMSLEIECLKRQNSRLFNALFRMVRQNSQGHPIGHDAIIAARSAVRRANPAKYAKLKIGGKK